MTAYTTHMQILTQLVAAQIAYKGMITVHSYDIRALADVANTIIRKSQEVAPTPKPQSTVLI